MGLLQMFDLLPFDAHFLSHLVVLICAFPLFYYNSLRLLVRLLTLPYWESIFFLHLRHKSTFFPRRFLSFFHRR